MEVDLIFEWTSKEGDDLKPYLFFIEVKSLSQKSFQFYRWKKKQKERFKKLNELMSYEYSKHEVFGLVAYVSQDLIEFYYLDEV